MRWPEGHHMRPCDDLHVTYTYMLFSVQSYSFIVRDPGKQYIGKASVLPEQLTDLEGTLVLTLHNADLSPVGTISCEKLEQIENIVSYSGKSLVGGEFGELFVICQTN